MQDRRPAVAAAHSLPDAKTVQGQHARLHAREQEGERDAQQGRQQNQDAAGAHRFLTASTSNWRMRRSSAACTVRRKPAKTHRVAGGGHDLELAEGQAGHGFATGTSRQQRIFAAEIVQAQTAADAPAVWGQLFQDGALGGVLAVNFPQHLAQDVLDGHDAGRAAKFVQDNGQAALLALEAFQQLQQVHALRDEGGKLDGQGKVRRRVQQQGAGVEDADNGVHRFIVNGQAAVFETPGGLDHFRDRKIVGDAGHLRARLHHVAGVAAVQIDDLQDDLLLARRQGALLIGHFEQLLVLGVGKAGGRKGGAGKGAQAQVGQALGHAAQGAADPLQQEHRAGHAQGPEFRGADGEGFGGHFARQRE